MPNVNEKVRVRLTPELRQEFETLVRKGSAPQAKVRRARVLLLADDDHEDGRRPDWQIAQRLGCSERQVSRIRQQFVGEGRDALDRKVRPDLTIPKKIDARAEATLVQLCCSQPPDGRDRWTLRLLCDEMVRLNVVESITPEAVRRRLKKMNCSPGANSGTASPTPTARASSPRWKRSSTSTTSRTTRRTR